MFLSLSFHQYKPSCATHKSVEANLESSQQGHQQLEKPSPTDTEVWEGSTKSFDSAFKYPQNLISQVAPFWLESPCLAI